MEQQHPLNDLMSTAMEKIRTMVDANTIIGTPIQTGDVTLIPVSRLSFGIASGGSDFVTKSQKPEQPKNFGGGSGASARLEPGGQRASAPGGARAHHHGGSDRGRSSRGGGQGDRVHREAAGEESPGGRTGVRREHFPACFEQE